MFCRLVLAGVVVAVVAGVGVAVEPAAATPQQAENGTAFEVDFADADIAQESTQLNVYGVPAGTPVEVTIDGMPRPTLIELFDGEPTANGVHVTVPANGSVPVDAPPACSTGDYDVTVQRLDTGGTATTHYTVTSELLADAEFSAADYGTTPDGVVPVTIETECHGVTLRIVDPDSAYSASITFDDGERNHTVWIDTARPTNASALFTAEIDANVTDRGRTEDLSELNGTYRLIAAQYDDTLGTANLTISPDATPRPTAGEGTISAEALSDQFTTNEAGDFLFLRIDGVPGDVPVTAVLRDPPAGYSQTTLAAMIRGEQVGDDIRTTRYENGTIELSAVPAIRCLGADLLIGFQRLDTGATATAEVSAVHESSVRSHFHRENYTVASGGVRPLTLTRDCHDLTLELARTDSNASASVELDADAPIERNETIWLSTSRAEDASGLFRSEVGTPTLNATTNFSAGALAPGTYRLRSTFLRHELGTARLTVTNESADGSTPDRMPDLPEQSPSTPDAPITDATRTDTPTTNTPTTDATPANRTAEGNAFRAAPTDAFGPTTTAETDGSGPGFGLPLTALALAVLAVLAARRTDD